MIQTLPDLTALSSYERARLTWLLAARPKQLPPAAQFYLWLILAGRGFGKTRTGGSWLYSMMEMHPGSRWALCAPTFGDARDIMLEGESGLVNGEGALGPIIPPDRIATYNRSLGELVLANGSQAKVFSSEKPDSWRGPNLDGAWGDEPATWRYGAACFTNLKLMVRKGPSRIVFTGTPKSTRFVRDLIAEADHVTTGHTDENVANLSAAFLERVVEPMRNTRTGRQELAAEMLEDVEGSLWVSRQLDYLRRPAPKPADLARVVIAVDPSATSTSSADECGIVAVGGNKAAGWVLGDYSKRASPRGWGAAAVAALHELDADYIVAESNNGGEMVAEVIRGVDPTVHVKLVHASRGKQARAEPVAALYGDRDEETTWPRASMFHAAGADLRLLEDQMTTWTHEEKWSPDRMDALVWGATEVRGLDAKQRGRGGLRFTQGGQGAA